MGEEYLDEHSKIVEKIELEIESLNDNINDIYNKYLNELNKLIGLEEVKEMKKTHDKLFEIIKNNTKLNDKQIEKILKSYFWVNSEEALEYGIVDKIIN